MIVQSQAIDSEDQFIHGKISEDQAHGMLLTSNGSMQSVGTFLVWQPGKKEGHYALSVVAEGGT